MKDNEAETYNAVWHGLMEEIVERLLQAKEYMDEHVDDVDREEYQSWVAAYDRNHTQLVIAAQAGRNQDWPLLIKLIDRQYAFNHTTQDTLAQIVMWVIGKRITGYNI